MSTALCYFIRCDGGDCPETSPVQYLGPFDAAEAFGELRAELAEAGWTRTPERGDLCPKCSAAAAAIREASAPAGAEGGGGRTWGAS